MHPDAKKIVHCALLCTLLFSSLEMGLIKSALGLSNSAKAFFLLLLFVIIIGRCIVMIRLPTVMLVLLILRYDSLEVGLANISLANHFSSKVFVQCSLLPASYLDWERNDRMT